MGDRRVSPAHRIEGSKPVLVAVRFREVENLSALDLPFETRQEFNSLHRSGKSQHRRQPVNVDTERQRNPVCMHTAALLP